MSFENELPEEWRGVLPEAMRSSGVLESVKTVEGLAKMAIDGRNLASTALRIPSEDASVEDRNAFNTDLMAKMPNLVAMPGEGEDAGAMWDKLGRPADTDGYGIEKIPEQIQQNIASLMKAGHDVGLSKAQMQGITKNIIDDFTSNMSAAVGKQEEDNNKLKGEWGAGYQPKVDIIKHFAEQTGFSDQFLDAIDEGQISSKDMKAFDHIIKGFSGEGVNIGQQPGDANATMTPTEAQTRIDEIMGNKEHAYWNASDPSHKAAIDKIIALGEIAETGRELSETERFRRSL